MYKSRLEQRYNRQSQKQIGLFILGSLVLSIVLVIYGFPLLFGLTGAISSWGRKTTAVINKTVAPNPPNFLESFAATASATIKIYGIADPKTTIEIFQNRGSLGTVISNDDGTFSQEVDLEKGQNTFTAVAVNENGKKSAPSKNYSVNLLTSKPKLDLIALNDGDTTNSSPFTISGQTDPGDFVTINDRLAIIDKDGKFTYPLTLNDGDNKIKIVATDPAGNQTAKELTLKYQH